MIITFPNYLDRIQVTKNRKVKYFLKDASKVIPKKYHNNTYGFIGYKNKDRIEYILTNKETNEKVIANPKAAGTPKNIMINGQSIYNQGINKFTRAIVMNRLKAYFKEYLTDVDSSTWQYPIKIKYNFYTTNNRRFDLDNHSNLYIKAFQDCLTNLNIIPDDNVNYINNIESQFTEIENYEDRKLEVEIVSSR